MNQKRETPIDPAALRGAIELLQGQIRAQNCVIAALMSFVPEDFKLTTRIGLVQSDLETELTQRPNDSDHQRQMNNWRNGASSAMRDIQQRFAAFR